MIQLKTQNTKKSPSFSANLELSKKAYKDFLQTSPQGFFKLLDRPALWESSEALAQKMQKKFKRLMVVGIGGSSLGTEVFQDFFKLEQIQIIDNVDPRSFQQMMQSLTSDPAKLQDTAWAFISKSGTTIETLSTLECILDVYEEKKLSWKDNLIVITENKKSTLSDFAKEHSLPQLEVPLDVGGRFSVFSPVGLFPLFFAGISPADVQQGMKAALANEELVTQLMAEFLTSFEREEWITCLWFYSSNCRALGQWFCQLWAESLAKSTTREGLAAAPRVSTPVWLKGACDQHSVLQQLMEGAKDKFILFLDFMDLGSSEPFISKPRFPETQVLRGLSLGKLLLVESQATREALRASGVSTAHMTFEKSDAQNVVQFMMTMMLTVGGLGEALNINAFDQPGVEMGKKLAKSILASTNV